MRGNGVRRGIGIVVSVVLLLAGIGVAPERVGATAYPCDEGGLNSALSAGGSATFSCTGPTTITLSGGKTITRDTALDGGLITLNGANLYTVFTVNTGVTATIANLTITNGNGANGGGIQNNGTLTVTDSVFSNNTAANGGAIVNVGMLTVTDSAFNSNHASNGGAIENSGSATVTNSAFSNNGVGPGFAGQGGAIFNYHDSTLTVTDSTLTGNTTTYIGGGIFNDGGTVNVTRSTLSGNATDDGGGGGGIYNYSGTVAVTDSTLRDNIALGGEGGGIFNDGTATVTNSTLSRNTAPYNNGTDGQGGGIYALHGSLALTNSTLNRNTVSYGTGGGGIFNGGSAITAKNSLIVNSDGGDVVSFTPDNTNITGPFTFASVLQNNGGATATLALPPGSPAIGKGDAAVCAATTGPNPVRGKDQRGVVRPGIAGGVCDIGSFESQGFTAGTPGGSGQTAPVTTAFAAPVRLTIASTHGESVAGGQITFTIIPGMSGASATFAGGGTTATGIVGMNGTVSSPLFTANGTAGHFTITAAAAGVSPATTTFAETITPGAVAHFAVSGFPSPTVAGVSGAVTVTAQDGFDNTVTGYTGTVAITSSDPAAILPANGPLTNGVGTFSVTFKTAGMGRSITAKDTTTVSITGQQTGIIVNPGPTARFLVTGFPSPVAASASGSVTVTAQDAFGNTATGYTGTVAVTSTDAAAILPANAPLTNGVGSVAVTLNTPGVQTITATDTVTASITGQQRGITVTPGPAVRFLVTGFPSPATAGTHGAVSVTAKDPAGNTATNYTGTVAITSSDPAATLPASATLTNGVGSFAVTLNTAGTHTITATDTMTASIMGAQTGITITTATVQSLTILAPTGTGSGNSGTASAPVLRAGGTLTLTTVARYSNGTSGPPGGVTYAGYDPQIITVDMMGNVTPLAPGTTTLTVTVPDGKGGVVTTTLTVQVTGGTGGGLMNPNPQPVTHGTAGAAATVAPQPARKADGAGSTGSTGGGSALPQAVGQPGATPVPQPGRH